MRGITVAGSLVLDITPITAAENHLSLVGGSQAYLDRIETSIGGCVGNTGVALHKLGFPVTLVGKVGDDAFGHMVRDVIDRSGCQSSIIMETGEATSCSIILLPDDGDRVILHKKGASNRLSATELLSAVATDSAMLHIGYMLNLGQLWNDGGDSLIGLLSRVREMGIAISADTSSIKRGDITLEYHRTMLERALGCCDIFMPSVSDIYPLYPEAFDADDIPGIARHFIDCGAAIVLVKNGSKGMYLQTAGRERIARLTRLFTCDKEIDAWSDRSLCMDAPAVSHIVSTTGAGDVAVAGFLASLLLDEPLPPAGSLSLATTLAGISLGSRDATSLIPDINGLLKKVRG